MTGFQIFLGIIILLGGSRIGYLLVDRFFMRGTYSIQNSKDLLKSGKIEEWNSLRDLNPDWSPDLTSFNFSNMNLTGINLRNAKLNKASFTGAILDYSDFSNASLNEATFENASLKRVILNNANMEGAVFKNSILENMSFKGANFESSNITVEEAQKYGGNPLSITEEIIPLIKKQPGIISNLNHIEFEELITILLNQLGFEAERTSRPGPKDKGYDILALRKDPIGDELYIIECKSYQSTRPVGVAPLLTLYSLKLDEKADRAMLVTNSYFSTKARQFAQRHKELELIDHDRLLEWVHKL
ncbi:MAG: restriction endonuclease [Desulfobacula sp.]|jgi:hypothetical protein|nr:restriction endonuclease [Desulfobacula sp.]